MKKRLLSILLAMCMALALLPGTAQAAYIEYPATGGNIRFDPETRSLTYCRNTVTAATIPTEINGSPVTSIGYGAFSECINLTSVIIPNSITTIEGWAFSKCSSLTSVTIPDSVTEIERCSFQGCSSLTSVTISNSVTFIGMLRFFIVEV